MQVKAELFIEIDLTDRSEPQIVIGGTSAGFAKLAECVASLAEDDSALAPGMDVGEHTHVYGILESRNSESLNLKLKRIERPSDGDIQSYLDEAGKYNAEFD